MFLLTDTAPADSEHGSIQRPSLFSRLSSLLQTRVVTGTKSAGAGAVGAGGMMLILCLGVCYWACCMGGLFGKKKKKKRRGHGHGLTYVTDEEESGYSY